MNKKIFFILTVLFISTILNCFDSTDSKSESVAVTGTIVVNVIGHDSEVTVTITGPETYTVNTTNGVAILSLAPAGTYSVSCPDLAAHSLYTYAVDDSIDTLGETLTFTSRYTFSPKYAIVGESGQVRYSSDGKKWSKNYGPGSGDLQDIAYSGSLFVATNLIGSISAFQSIDGKNWTTLNVEGESTISGIVYVNEAFVIVTTHGDIYRASENNLTLWYGDYYMNAGLFYDVAASPYEVLAVSNDDCYFAFTSSLTSWTAKDEPPSSTAFYGATYANSVFYVVGTNGTNPGNPRPGGCLYIISGGSGSWSLSDGFGPGGDALLGVACGAGHTVVVGYNGTIQYTGLSPTLSWTDVSISSGEHLNDIVYGDQGFVVVGNAGTILHSTDGESWTDVSVGSTDYNSVIYID